MERQKKGLSESLKKEEGLYYPFVLAFGGERESEGKEKRNAAPRLITPMESSKERAGSASNALRKGSGLQPASEETKTIALAV